ncbi:MAG: D-Ala-D-Ala carboxypeptidase family metallohydrolase [Prevotella sp.]|nr:D-Ala-D-Ala carboxypeptidase family metallohydrolase [Prevotella sp.]
MNSGFRCPVLNERVNGVGNSQHLWSSCRHQMHK